MGAGFAVKPLQRFWWNASLDAEAEAAAAEESAAEDPRLIGVIVIRDRGCCDHDAWEMLANPTIGCLPVAGQATGVVAVVSRFPLLMALPPHWSPAPAPPWAALATEQGLQVRWAAVGAAAA